MNGIRCSRCRRSLRNPVYIGGSAYGATCAAAVAGVKQKRQRRQPARDEKQTDLFAEDLSYAHKVDALLGGISLEMPR